LPRQSRKLSQSMVYHCMLRGINKQDIFFDKQDYFKFQRVLKRSKEIFSYKLYSYILMPNHIHLEIKDETFQLSKIIQHIASSYAQYFNKKYIRTGHVFENRFLSKNVENANYILNLVRYIHQNPVKAGIGDIETYKWGSYLEYLMLKKDKQVNYRNKYNSEESVVDVEDIISLFILEKQQKLEDFFKFNKEIMILKNSNELMEYEMRNTLKDEELIYFIKKQLNIQNIQEIQKYNANSRNEIILKIKEIKGVTQKQIARVLGINIRIVQRAYTIKKKPFVTKVTKNGYSGPVPKLTTKK